MGTMVDFIGSGNFRLLKEPLEKYRRAINRSNDYLVDPEWVHLVLQRFANNAEFGLCYSRRGKCRGFLVFKPGKRHLYVSMYFALRGDDRLSVIRSLFMRLKEIFPAKVILVGEIAPDVSFKSQLSIFENLEFKIMERLKMQLRSKEVKCDYIRPEGFVFRKYSPKFKHLLPKLDERAYQGQPDEIFMKVFADVGDLAPALRLVEEQKSLFEDRLSTFAFHNQELAGAIYCTKSGRTLGIANIAIDPKYQGHGLGKGLLSKVVTAMEIKGYHKCELLVSKENSKAVVLYKKIGFKLKRYCPIFVYRTGQGV